MVPERVPYRTTFLRLLGFLRPYRVGLIVSAVLATLAQGAQVAILYLVGSVVKAMDGCAFRNRSWAWGFWSHTRGTSELSWVWKFRTIFGPQ